MNTIYFQFLRDLQKLPDFNIKYNFEYDFVIFEIYYKGNHWANLVRLKEWGMPYTFNFQTKDYPDSNNDDKLIISVKANDLTMHDIMLEYNNWLKLIHKETIKAYKEHQIDLMRFNVRKKLLLKPIWNKPAFNL